METLIFLLILILLLLLNNTSLKSSFASQNCLHVTVDKIFVLTLKKSTERRENFINAYKALTTSAPLEIIYGIDTKNKMNAEKYREIVDPVKFNLMYDLDAGIKQRKQLSEFNSGALGCYLGHMEMYQRSFNQNTHYALFCEDNIVFKPSFISDINKLSLPSDFDIIFFHTWNHIGKGFNSCEHGLKKVTKVMGTKCYLVNVRSMKKYFPLFYPIDTHIDLKYFDLIKQGCTIYYLPLQSLEIKYTSESSTIGHSLLLNEKGEDIAHQLFEQNN